MCESCSDFLEWIEIWKAGLDSLIVFAIYGICYHQCFGKEKDNLYFNKWVQLMHICYACFWTLYAFVIYGILTHYHFQRNLPPTTGSGSSTKTNAVGWAAFWWREHLLIINEGVHFIVFVSLRRKKNVRRERITKYLEDCHTAMYFLLSCYQCYFLLPAPATSNLNFSLVYNRDVFYLFSCYLPCFFIPNRG